MADEDMEQNNEDVQERENSKKSQNRKSRGATTGKRMKKISGPMHIKFDSNGRPCGKWRGKYSSQIGILARAVDINIDKWKSVPDGLKDTIWIDLQKTFYIDECHKSNVLGHVASCWKNFKTNLTSKFVYETRKQNRKVPLKDPLSMYSFISKEQWEKFIKSREDPSFKKKSEAGRAAQKFNVHPHYLGRSGYSGKRDEWFQEELQSTLTMSTDVDAATKSDYVASLLSDRSYNWIKARTPKQGRTIPEQTQEMINEIKRWQEKEKHGEFVANRFDDVLTMATKKRDYPGRTRGVGSRVRLRAYFGLPNDDGLKGERFTEEYLRLFEHQITERVKKETMASMDSWLEKKFKLAGVKLPLEAEVNTESAHPDQNSCHSIDSSIFDEAKDPLSCQLGVELNSKDFVVVAKGTFWPTIVGASVHNVPLMMDHVKITIDQIIEPKAPLPVPFGGFKTVGEVEGSFGQWPKKWVLIGDETNVTQKKKSKVVDKGKDTRESIIDDAHGPLITMDKYCSLGYHCQSLHDMLKRSQKTLIMYTVNFPKEVYHYTEDIKVPVSVEDIVQMFELDWLNISIIQIWGRYLFSMGGNLGVDNIGYLCPERLSSIERDPLESLTYIVNALLNLSQKKFILAPYHECGHWMLIVICTGRNEVYFMDPKQANGTGMRKLKEHLDMAFRAYCQRGGDHDVKKGNSLQWPKTLCPQQPGSYECGYYVMKFMFEIVLIHMKKDELSKCFKVSSYSTADINQVRDLWAEYFMEHCV